MDLQNKNVSDQSAQSILARPPWLKIGSYVLGLILLIFVVLGIYWSRTPDVFWVNQQLNGERTIVGYSTTDTLIRISETLLEKPGGYLSNDRMPPSVFLDNMPNWEFGVLQQVRDLARVIRNDYSRSQSQSIEDEDISTAEPKFFFDNDSWILPPSESEYRDAIRGFASYRDRLVGGDGPNAQFFARADNLREWLAQVEKRLGSLSRRLGNSVASTRINEDLAGDPAAAATSANTDTVDVRTSWFEVDDVFFEARGTAFGRREGR